MSRINGGLPQYRVAGNRPFVFCVDSLVPMDDVAGSGVSRERSTPQVQAFTSKCWTSLGNLNSLRMWRDQGAIPVLIVYTELNPD